MLDATGEETSGFQEEAEAEILEEGLDSDLVDVFTLSVIHKLVMCAGCVAIWHVTVPKTQRLLEEVEPLMLDSNLDSCIEAQPAIGVEDGALTLVD